MSVTRNLQSSVLFALPFIGYQPANISNGEPALTAANIIKQTILGPPFKWPFNRGILAFDIDGSSQDYLVNQPNFGFLEQIWLTDNTSQKVKEIEVKRSLAAESSIQRPQSAAAQILDDEDNITFRLNAIPDTSYSVEAFFQQAPNWMASLACLWAPIPDHLAYIADWGFMGMLSMLTKDARSPIFMQKFVSHLLGAQEGLTQLERNIFLGGWLDVMTQQQSAQMTTQQGVAARQN